MRRPAWILTFACLSAILCSACSGATAIQGTDEAAIVAHMKALLLDAQSRLGTPEEGVDVTVVDHAIGYTYSERDGLQPWVLIQPDAAGTVALPDGSQVPPSPDVVSSLGLSPTATYGSYRRVRSIAGFSSEDAHVSLPTGITGLDEAGESAYNYIRMQTLVPPGHIQEFGVWTDRARQSSDKRWYVYGRWDGSWEYFSGNPTVAEGSSVHLSVSIPENYKVDELCESGATRVFKSHYNVPWAVRGGVRFRRVTSFFMNHSGTSLSNHWTSVYLDSTLFGPNQLYDKYTSPQFTYVSEITPYSNEQICFCVP